MLSDLGEGTAAICTTKPQLLILSTKLSIIISTKTIIKIQYRCRKIVSPKVIQDNFDWDYLGLDSIDALPFADNIDPDIATLSPPIHDAYGNEQCGRQSLNDSDDCGLGSILSFTFIEIVRNKQLHRPGILIEQWI